MLNRAILYGRLVADPELRHTPNGVAVGNFRMAVDRDFKDRDTGERKTDFINVAVWRHTAEFVSRSFAKGQLILVEGRLQTNEFTDKNGVKRTSLEVVADNCWFGGPKSDTKTAQSNGGQYAPPAFVDLPPDDSLPFDMDVPPFPFEQLPL